ncbi:MAG: ABC transporter ATP-binding protein [Planctomycetota bacterium]|nr:MAG: ABC transporter ATP-binding protein [Planctomycetota bacterium]
MLEFRRVSKSFHGSTVVHSLDLTIDDGEILVLLGPSGCGKTTILRMVAGLIWPTTGEVVFDGTPLGEETIGAVRRKLGYVIQEGGLFPHLTGVQNVTLMARHEGWTPAQIKSRLDELLEMTQFPTEGLDRYPNELSGGQRQRLSLMRALFLRPSLLLMDEPLGALDPLIRAGLQRDLKEVFARTGATVLMVTHDLVEAGRFADRVCVIQSGRIVQQGPFHEIMDEPANDFVSEFVNSQVVAT